MALLCAIGIPSPSVWLAGGIALMVQRLSTGWTVGFEPQWGKEIFNISYLSVPALGPNELCIQREMAHFPGSTAVRAGADHPSQTSADIKNQYSYITAPSMCHQWHGME